MTTREERADLLTAASNNLFFLKSADVIIDLLTDSGTGAMSSEQWAAVMRGDESYAGSPSFGRFEAAVQEIFGFQEVIPTHQGRAAEHILFGVFGGSPHVIPNNSHFDTTRANAEQSGAIALDHPCKESEDTCSAYPFKGNMDLKALAATLEANKGNVPLVMVTITNNAGGGQPVSLENMRGIRELCDKHEIPFFIDACRFAENAWFIKQREHGQSERPIRAIVRDMFDLADGCTMSAKKDAIANIGGFLACRDKELADEFRRRLVVTEGFPTYGGLAGRDLEAVAQGLNEVVEEDYLNYRAASIRYVVEALHERGIPVLRPAGGHAIFLDAGRFLDHLPWQQYPGHALALEIYLEGGIRACEIGTVMLGGKDALTGEETPAHHELVRLAIPRRTYTQSHMDYVIEIVDAVYKRRASIAGVTIETSPPVLRHFGATFSRSGVGVTA